VRTGSVSLSTSGSTGEPKVVELDEQRLLHVAGAVVDHHRLVPADRGYSPLPLFHVNAQVVAVLATFLAGATVVLDRRFRRRGFWQLLQEREITWLNAVPAILAIVAGEDCPLPLPQLRFVRSASAPLPPTVRDRIEALLSVRVVESYGMTEAASQITATPLHAGAPAGSAGRPVSVELQVRDPYGAVAEPGALGRIWIRGRGVITSYAGGRAAERFDADGWLDTADLGSVDPDGFVFLAGRADDVINRGGEMVHPREVEEVLLSHPRVAEAVVVGQSHATLGAVPVGYVLAHHGANAGLTDELQQWCAERLSRFKQPVALHVVTDFPRAATGKIRRYEVA
jgi:acyl-CoA synthetase (AMP-forming)/AMP-acid ligase II